jgi:hypothetical protein
MDERLTGRSVGKPARRFNLFYKGTGVRFRVPQPSRAVWPKRALLAVLLFVATAAAAAFYFYPHPFGRVTALFNEGKNDDDETDGEIPPALEQAAIGAKSDVKRPVVRFGVFASRDDAESLARRLQKQDIFANIRSAQGPATTFTVRAPFGKDGASLETISSELAKINVAPTPRTEQEYVLIGPFWTKEGAVEAAKKMGDLGFQAAVEEGSAQMEAFEVVSQPLDDEAVANYKMTEWRGKGFEGVIER